MDKETVELLVLIISPILSLVGAWVGSRVRVAKLEEWKEAVKSWQDEREDEIMTLRKRTHKHSTILTLVAAKTGVRYQGED
jgi:hypothetical protein